MLQEANARSVQKCITMRIIISSYSFPIGFKNDPFFPEGIKSTLLMGTKIIFCVFSIINFQLQKAISLILSHN